MESWPLALQLALGIAGGVAFYFLLKWYARQVRRFRRWRFQRRMRP